MGTQLESRPRYTPTTTFETFPFPWPLNKQGSDLTAQQRLQRDQIAEAARELNELREAWLNPPEWVREEPDLLPDLPPRKVPVDENAAKKLAKRTLTNLYNQRPAWLDQAHQHLDAAVLDAYGWPHDISDDDLLERLLELNLKRSTST